MPKIATPAVPVNAQVKRIGLSGVACPTQRRTVRQDVVDALAKSMKEIGLINPITLREREGHGYYLIAGRHRYEAAKQLKWESIPAIVLEGITADDAELTEIDENLIRANLSPAEEAAHHARRKELYEKRHPETKRGGDRKSAKRKSKPQNGDLKSYSKDTAAKTGKSRDTVERAVRRGKKIPDVASLAGTSLDKGDELDAVAKLPQEQQAELIEKAKAGEQVSAKAVAPPHVEERTGTKGHQQPVHKSQTASPDKPMAEPVSSPPIVPSAKPTKSSQTSVNTAPPLNSLSWSVATADSRRKFIDAVGVVSLWEAMSEEQKTWLINHIMTLEGAADAAKIEGAHCS